MRKYVDFCSTYVHACMCLESLPHVIQAFLSFCDLFFEGVGSYAVTRIKLQPSIEPAQSRPAWDPRSIFQAAGLLKLGFPA